MTTKEKIQQEALNQFNAQGVEKVTTRHIAAALNMSQGNLHYHYASREVVIQVLFDRFVAESRASERFRGELISLETMRESMHDNFERMYHYRFLFKDNEVVWRRVPAIKGAMTLLFERLRERLTQLVAVYHEHKKFRPECTAQQREQLVEQMVFTASSWLSAAEYQNQSLSIAQARYYADYCFRIWEVYLKAE